MTRNRTLRQKVYERDQGICAKCGVYDAKWEADHILELSFGGRDELDNMQTLCRRHHRDKTSEAAPELAGDDRRCHETNDAQIKHMANRFLSWPNLLTVPKAEAMVRYMLVGNDRKEVMPHTGRTPKHDKTQAPSPVGGAAPPDFTERAREIRRRAWRRHASELHSTGLLLAEIVEQEIAADLSQLAAETEARVRREVVSMAEKFVIETAMSGPARRVLRQCIRALAAPQPDDGKVG